MQAQTVPVRDVLVHLLWRWGDWRLSDVGEYFGVGPSRPAIASRRGAAHLQANRCLAEQVKRIIE